MRWGSLIKRHGEADFTRLNLGKNRQQKNGEKHGKNRQNRHYRLW